MADATMRNFNFHVILTQRTRDIRPFFQRLSVFLASVSLKFFGHLKEIENKSQFQGDVSKLKQNTNKMFNNDRMFILNVYVLYGT